MSRKARENNISTPLNASKTASAIKWPTGLATWGHWECDHLSGVVGKEAPLKWANKLKKIKINE